VLEIPAICNNLRKEIKVHILKVGNKTPLSADDMTVHKEHVLPPKIPDRITELIRIS
jgi:hypothetical protein